MFKNIIKRIKIKFGCCCKSKCSLNELEQLAEEDLKEIEDIKNKIKFING